MAGRRRRLPRKARRLIGDEASGVFVSAASAWEIATKARLGRLPNALDVAADVSGCAANQGFEGLDITIRHAQRAGGLGGPLRDPFDRILIAQVLIEDLPIVSNERVFDSYGISRIG